MGYSCIGALAGAGTIKQKVYKLENYKFGMQKRKIEAVRNKYSDMSPSEWARALEDEAKKDGEDRHSLPRAYKIF